MLGKGLSRLYRLKGESDDGRKSGERRWLGPVIFFTPVAYVVMNNTTRTTPPGVVPAGMLQLDFVNPAWPLLIL
jgi:hypothetical protein